MSDTAGAMTDPLSLRAMVERLRELDTKATPAPWHTNAADYGCPISDDTGGSIIAVWPERANGSKVDAEANGALVTFVRNNLSQIIEALTAQSSWANEKARLEKLCNDLEAEALGYASEKAEMERQLDQVLATAQVSYAEAFEMLAALRHASLPLAAKKEP